MAEADRKDDRSSKKGGGMIRSLLIAGVLMLAGGGAATFYFSQTDATDPAGAPQPQRLAEPHYWAFLPSFVVNLPDGVYMRYLKVDVELMTRDARLPPRLEAHAPVLRHRLLMLYSSADYQTLLSREGKEALQQASLEEINAQLDALGLSAVEDLYFTSFVMQ